MSIALDAVLPEKRAARRAFEHALGFDTAAFVHAEARARLLERLELLGIAPQIVADVGCATGHAALALSARYPSARVLGIDTASTMLRAARSRVPAADLFLADAEQLPFRAHTVDLFFANMLLPWCRPAALFAEAARVLRANGLLVFATLGPDSLMEVRRAFATVDRAIHVHAAFDLHDLGDWVMAAGLAEPVLDVDRIQVTYSSAKDMVQDLRAVGGINVAAGRRRGLMGPRQWARFESELAAGQARFGLTVELILGSAWGVGARVRVKSAPGEVAIPVAEIRRSSGNT